MNLKSVYNLEFPSWTPEMTIGGYRFSRRSDYSTQVGRLQHLVSFDSEFHIQGGTGGHAVTAEVDIPLEEPRAVIGWPRPDEPALADILLLLSLFTGRDVFLAGDPDVVIPYDPRVYEWGGVLRSAVSTSTLARRGMVENGFAQCMNRVYTRIQNPDWLRDFQQGYFLILAQHAFRRQRIEWVFIQCWTIWDHLYGALAPSRFDCDQPGRVPAPDKAVALLQEFAPQGPVDPHTVRRMKTLASLRQDLFYRARYPLVPSRVYNEVVLFIRLTEFVIVKVLGL